MEGCAGGACTGQIGLRLLEFVPRHDVVRSSPAYENLISRKGTCRQSIVLDGKAAANHDKARIGFWRLDQQIGRHGGAVADATQPRSSAPRVGCAPKIGRAACRERGVQYG